MGHWWIAVTAYNATITTANADRDSDGVPDWSEVVAGTK
jgi:hypothetical protein